MNLDQILNRGYDQFNYKESDFNKKILNSSLRVLIKNLNNRITRLKKNYVSSPALNQFERWYGDIEKNISYKKLNFKQRQELAIRSYQFLKNTTSTITGLKNYQNEIINKIGIGNLVKQMNYKERYQFLKDVFKIYEDITEIGIPDLEYHVELLQDIAQLVSSNEMSLDEIKDILIKKYDYLYKQKMVGYIDVED